MAETIATRRPSKRGRAATVDQAVANHASRRLRLFGIVVALGIAGGAIGLAYWQPSLLTERLAPLWESAGPWLIIAPLLLISAYITFRIAGLFNLRVWKWALIVLIGMAAVQTALHSFDVTQIRGVSIESNVSRYLADYPDLVLIGITVGLIVITLALILPLSMVAALASIRPRRAQNDEEDEDGVSERSRDSASESVSRASALERDLTQLEDPPFPRMRLFMPDPVRNTARATYPEPVGVVRDQQRRLDEERQATREPQEQRPRIIMPGVPSDAEANSATRAFRQRYIGRDAAETAETLTTESGPETDSGLNSVMEHDDATALSDRTTTTLPPPGLSRTGDHPAGPPVHSDLHGEGAGMDHRELEEMALRDPLAITDDDLEDDVFEGGIIDSLEELDPEQDAELSGTVTVMNTWGSAEDERDSVIDDGIAEQDALAGDSIGPRSDQALLDSLDPFAGLPQVAWRFPSFTLFDEQPPAEVDTESHLETAEAIQETLQEYGIEVEVTEVRPGPTVTLYGVRPGWDRRYRTVRERNEDGEIVAKRQEVGRTRVKVDAIAKLDDDLALQLKAASVRIEPIQGTNLVGVEVPNMAPETVYMRPQLESDAYRKARGKSRLAFPLGKGSGGEPVVADLARMPHLLVAGSTGSGKSVFVNSLITSLITRATPEELRFVMIDPKRVELTIYNGIPHLITPVIVDTQRVVNALQWVVQQMEDRLEQLAQEGARDITSYNERMGDGKRMPYIVLIIDELADLMMTSGKAVENGLVRLAQMGRATGIHLVVATQRPSVNVITGLIKANFPTRISFMVTSLVDSRTILDGSGAEKLLGRGDMLYLPQDVSRPIRIQSAFISSHESDAVVDAWRTQAKGYLPPELPDLVQPEDIGLQSRGRNGTDSGSEINGAGRNGSGNDDIMEQARELADIYKGKVSTSLLQRRLGIGYPRAARLRDRLVEEGLAKADIPNAPVEAGGRSVRRTREQPDDSADDE